jgi:hypothetical protein
MIIYYRFSIYDYEVNINWLQSKCLQNTVFKYRMGIDYTYFDFTMLFALIGATFGCAFANSKIDGYLSQETSTAIRLFRTIVGMVLFKSIFVLCSLIPVDNYLTEYFFIKALPNFVASYFVYGIYPYSWVYLGLIEVYMSETDYSEEGSEELDKNKMDEIKEGSERDDTEEYDEQIENIEDFVVEKVGKLVLII